MANYRRSRPRNKPKCTLCTDARGKGNKVLGRHARKSKKFWPKIEDETID